MTVIEWNIYEINTNAYVQ